MLTQPVNKQEFHNKIQQKNVKSAKAHVVVLCKSIIKDINGIFLSWKVQLKFWVHILGVWTEALF